MTHRTEPETHRTEPNRNLDGVFCIPSCFKLTDHVCCALICEHMSHVQPQEEKIYRVNISKEVRLLGSIQFEGAPSLAIAMNQCTVSVGVLQL